MFSKFCSYHYPILDSTNKHAKRWLKYWRRDAATLISAGTQTHGYGQFGRQWFSPDCNLHYTYLYPLPQLPHYVANVAQVTALAVAKAITLTCNLNIKLKWPNDLILQQHKLGGVLVETATIDTCCFLIIGIGLNVNSTAEQLSGVGQPAISLLDATGKWQCRKTLTHHLNCQLLNAMASLHQHGFEYFHRDYAHMLVHHIGEEIPFKRGKHTGCGNYHGIAPDGALMLSDSSGQITTIYSNCENQ